MQTPSIVTPIHDNYIQIYTQTGGIKKTFVFSYLIAPKRVNASKYGARYFQDNTFSYMEKVKTKNMTKRKTLVKAFSCEKNIVFKSDEEINT
jgi:hypothetical protein